METATAAVAAPGPRKAAAVPRRKRLADPLDDDQQMLLDGEEDGGGSNSSHAHAASWGSDASAMEAGGEEEEAVPRRTAAVASAKTAALKHAASQALSRATRRAEKTSAELDDDEEDDGAGSAASFQDPLIAHEAQQAATALKMPPASDASGEEPAADTKPYAAAADGAVTAQQQWQQQLQDEAADSPYRQLPVEQLVEVVCAYMRATENPRLVNPHEEAQLFPALILRMEEVPIQLLLAVVAGHWTRSTLLRYGTSFKDMVRDFIASNAATLTPEETLDAIVVMGISAGRRKRDLDFFQMLGIVFAQQVNHYKDPHDLVKVLTAFNRAKIIPPDSFLALIARRLPILSKKHPMQPLACFRAFVNLKRMGHEQLNPFRFLADRILEAMQENIKKEMIAEKMKQQQEGGATGGEAAGWNSALADDVLAKAKYVRIAGLKLSQLTKLLYILASSGAPHQQYLRPLVKPLLAPCVALLPPPSLSRLLKALTRFAAADKDILLPAMHEVLRRSQAALATNTGIILPDLLELLSLLRSPDVPLAHALARPSVSSDSTAASVPTPGVDAEGVPAAGAASPFEQLLALVEHVSAHDLRLRPADMLGITSALVAIRDKVGRETEDEALLQARMGGDDTAAAATAAAAPTSLFNIKKTKAAPAKANADEADDPDDEAKAPPPPPLPQSPQERAIHARLERIVASFATRMVALLDLGVLALTHAEILEDIAKVHGFATLPALVELKAARRRINHDIGDDEYATMLDIDVRETFHKMLIVNNWNTFGDFKPLPGVLQVDFKQALTEVSAETILTASHLFAQAFPQHMTVALQRALSRAFLRKVDSEGEEVLTDDRLELVLRPAKPLLFSKEALPRFANLLAATPLERVKQNAGVWQLVQEKAERLQLPKVLRVATEHLAAIEAAKGKK